MNYVVNYLQIYFVGELLPSREIQDETWQNEETMHLQMLPQIWLPWHRLYNCGKQSGVQCIKMAKYCRNFSLEENNLLYALLCAKETTGKNRFLKYSSL